MVDPSITRKREQPELLEGYKKVYKNLHKYLGARRLDPYDNCSLADLALVRIDYCDYHFTTDVTDTENGATRITAHVHLMSRIRKQDWLKGQQVVLPIMSLEKEWDKVEQIPHIGFAPEAGENDGFSDMSQEDDLFFLAGQGKAPSTDADAKEALREEAERAITAHLIDASTLHPDVYVISLRDFEIGLDLKGLGRLCVNRRAFKGVRKISRVHTNLGTSRYEKFSLKKWRRFIKDAGPDLIDLRLFSDGYHVIHWPVLELDRLTSDVLDYCPHLQELHVGLATPESGKVVGLDIYWLDAEWGNDTVEELHLELATDLLRGRKSTPFPLLALSLSLAPIMAKGGRIVLTDQVGMHYWVEQKAAVELHHFQPEINRCVQYLLSCVTSLVGFFGRARCTLRCQAQPRHAGTYPPGRCQVAPVHGLVP